MLFRAFPGARSAVSFVRFKTFFWNAETSQTLLKLPFAPDIRKDEKERRMGHVVECKEARVRKETQLGVSLLVTVELTATVVALIEGDDGP